MGVRASKLIWVFKANGLKVKRLKPSPVVPRGYVPVCVGTNNTSKRFMVHRNSLVDVEFVELLYRSAEEYGFRNQGVLQIPYDPEDFEERMIRRSKRKMLRVIPAYS